MSEKTTLIILPGWGGSHETWAQFIALAEKKCTVHCIDLPCFGNEPCPTTPWGVEEYAQFVYEKIRDLRLQNKSILLGHSFGGQVATKVAHDHPELFNAVVLVAAAVIRPAKKVRRWMLSKVAHIGKFFFSFPIIEDRALWFKKMFYAGIDARDYAETAGIKRAIFQKVIREDLSTLLPHITLPSLVVWGTLDAYVPLRDGKRVAALLPHSTLHIVAKGKHGLHLQDPAGLLAVVERFINERTT